MGDDRGVFSEKLVFLVRNQSKDLYAMLKQYKEDPVTEWDYQFNWKRMRGESV